MVTRKIIQIDEEKCSGCGKCVVNCHEGALEIIDGKARVVNEHFCDGLGACIGECPEDALRIIEKDAPEFDESAVLEHLQQRKSRAEFIPKKQAKTTQPTCSCPSAQPLAWESVVPKENVKIGTSTTSEIRQWPLKLRLVPPFAPFFQEMERLVVVSDCASLAYPAMHAEFLRGASLVQVCPKFENPQENATKLGGILQFSPKLNEIHVIEMEVPCCGHLLQVVMEAVALSGRKKELCVKEAIIDFKGNLLGIRSYPPETANSV